MLAVGFTEGNCEWAHLSSPRRRKLILAFFFAIFVQQVVFLHLATRETPLLPLESPFVPLNLLYGLLDWHHKPGPGSWWSHKPVGSWWCSNLICGCCSVAQSYPTLCHPMDCSMPGFPVLHYLPEFTQTHIHWTDGAIQPSHSLSFHSLPAFNLSQHQGFFQWVSSSHQVAKVLEFQLQHQSFQWIFRTDFL